MRREKILNFPEDLPSWRPPFLIFIAPPFLILEFDFDRVHRPHDREINLKEIFLREENFVENP